MLRPFGGQGMEFSFTYQVSDYTGVNFKTYEPEYLF
jgi:hypothetical protein